MPLASASALNQPSRLSALQATGLLNAPPQEALDRLTRLATQLIGVPIALVSLVDDTHQRFASQVGLVEPWATRRETPLSHSFCQHVVASRQALVIPDARVNPLVFDNLAIPDLGVVAYAGLPITSESGEVLGSFCAIDTAQREWTPAQLSILADLAHAATAEIQLRAASRLLGTRQTFLADLLDHTSELVCATDAHDYIGYANRAMLETTGYSEAELALMRPSDLVRPEDAQLLNAEGQRLHTGEALMGLEATVITKQGQHLFCRGRALPIFGDDGTVTGARIIFRDLTKEREAERLKDELIALVSHELRAPIGAIRGALKVITPHVAHLEGKPKQMFEMASRNAARLLTLVNDLLDIERLEAGRAELQRVPVDTRSLLDQARDSMQALADDAGVAIEAGGLGVKVLADDARIQQVLINLIGNAIKFSPRGGIIKLTADAWPPVDGTAMVCFCVADQGRGIPADKLKRVFERFEQVSTTDASEKGGAGLGLAISRAIVQQHGGQIWVESPPGGGCRFQFTLPMA